MKLTSNDSYIASDVKETEYNEKQYYQAVLDVDGYNKSFNCSKSLADRIVIGKRYKVTIDYDKYYDSDKKVFNHKVKLVDIIEV